MNIWNVKEKEELLAFRTMQKRTGPVIREVAESEARVRRSCITEADSMECITFSVNYIRLKLITQV